MSIRDNVARLTAQVEAGRFVEAIDAYYAEDAISHESTGIVTIGKQALLEKERNFLTTVVEWTHIKAVDVLVDGQMAAIHWMFEFVLGGKAVATEEVALQHWRGDGTVARVEREQYFTLPPAAPKRD